MPTSSTGSPRHCSGPSGYSNGPSPSLSSSQKSYEERCVDPPEDWAQNRKAKTVHKVHLKVDNGKECETIGFIPGSADSATGTQSCGPCASPGSCRTFVCSVLTCGLYRVCQRTILVPCLEPNESFPDEPEKVSLQAVNPTDNKEEDGTDWLGDLHIAGVKVDSQREDLNVVTKDPSYTALAGGHKQPSHPSFYESLNYDDWGDSNEDVDSLIAKKLLELYSEYQIEELARCTSDSVFLQKTKEINKLINSLAEEHKLDEQEAECRLVRGIIRISTRKSKKRGPHYTRTERTLSDSGNETMRDSDSFSFSNNNDYKSNPNIQISELTHSDMYARKMRKNSGGYTSGSPTVHSPTHTDTTSSGAPLIRTSVRT
ncbi:keratinocyte differentiation factor 1 isoform 1-T2 [Polymixia lowei]